MLRATFVTAAVLILLGVGFYVGSGMESWTPLIPAFMGLIIGGCGLLATIKQPLWVRPAAMHAALILALLGFAATIGGVSGVVKLIQGGEVAAGVERPLASVLQTCTAVVLLIYLVLGVRSFLAARRSRKLEASNPPTREGSTAP